MPNYAYQCPRCLMKFESEPKRTFIYGVCPERGCGLGFAGGTPNPHGEAPGRVIPRTTPDRAERAGLLKEGEEECN